jgi:hypothetical protein
VKLVLQRLAQKEREAKQVRDATALRRQAAPPLLIGE